MKIVIFQGGLGNQIFQYLFYQYIKKHISKHVFGVVRDGNNHNGFELDKFFKVNLSMPTWLYLLFNKFERYKHRIPKILQNVFILEPKEEGTGIQFIYDGYWQSKKYLDSCRICFKDLNLSARNLQIQQKMEKSNSIALHVRRGDYLLPPHCTIFANICTVDYYKKAIEICHSKMQDCHFFVFSDDMEWAKKNLPINNACYIDWNVGNDSIYDMYLMSLAKVNIIANSTFSFWGAYLNRNDKMVIYPKKWYNEDCGVPVPDIFPNDWIGIF